MIFWKYKKSKKLGGYQKNRVADMEKRGKVFDPGVEDEAGIFYA